MTIKFDAGGGDGKGLRITSGVTFFADSLNHETGSGSGISKKCIAIGVFFSRSTARIHFCN